MCVYLDDTWGALVQYIAVIHHERLENENAE